MANLLYDASDRVATITINRPEHGNAMDLRTLDALHEAWVAAEGDPDIRAVILTGAGDVAFSTGADGEERARAELRARTAAHPALFPELVLAKPLIAAVNGACLAEGCELLLACDIGIAARGAAFGLPEPQVGRYPAGGSAVRAPRRLGWTNAMMLLLTGETVDAEEALRIGLVSRVVEPAELMPTARAVARRIARNTPSAVRAIKRCAIESDGIPLEEAFERDRAHARLAHASPDAPGGIRPSDQERTPGS